MVLGKQPLVESHLVDQLSAYEASVSTRIDEGGQSVGPHWQKQAGLEKGTRHHWKNRVWAHLWTKEFRGSMAFISVPHPHSTVRDGTDGVISILWR